jgi:hypothetical protein
MFYGTCRFAIAALLTTRLHAQSIAVHSVLAQAATVERATLVGGGVTLGKTVSHGALFLQLRGEAMRGSRDRIASACTGLVPIGTTLCDPQRLSTATTLESGSIGLRVPLMHHARMTFSVLGTLGIARIGTESRDSLRRTRLDARRIMFVPEAGVDWRWQPKVRLPIALNVGVAIGSIRSFVDDQVVDGYAPFNDALGLRRAWLGVAYAFER